MPRPKAQIDTVELEKLCGMQCTDVEIAAWFGVSTRTVERRRKNTKFCDVMDQAKAKGRVSVRRSLFRLAASGNIAAAIFLSKNILGYRDVVASELSGPGGQPIQISEEIDLSKVSDDELKQIATILSKAGPAPKIRG
jgi:hypothetical protein